MPIGRRHCRILPLKVESVRFVRRFGTAVIPFIVGDIRHPVRGRPTADRCSAAVSVRILSDYRPAILLPFHRLQVHYASVSPLVLEMNEPVGALRSIHPSSLMRSVDGAFRRSHDYLLLIRAEGVIGAKHCLPARPDSACRAEDIILPPALVHLGSLYGRLGFMPVEYHTGRTDEFRAVRRHGRNEHDALEPGAGACGCMAQVGLAVIVPQRAGIDESAALVNPDRVLPRAARILSLHHEYAAIRVSAINIEPAFVVADRRSPCAVAVLNRRRTQGFEIIYIIVGKRRTDKFPVHQILGMQNRQPREVVERRGGHIVVVPDAANVRIGIIHMKNWIVIAHLRCRHELHQQRGKNDQLFHNQRFAEISNHCAEPFTSPLLQHEPNQYSSGWPEAMVLRHTP